MSQKNYQQKTSLGSEAVCSEPHSDLAKQLFPELQQSHLSLPACFRRIQPRDITLPLQRAGNQGAWKFTGIGGPDNTGNSQKTSKVVQLPSEMRFD